MKRLQITEKNSIFLLFISIAVFYIIYILRLSIDIDGKTYFVLFDDAMISMTYAKNFANGHGLVWNPGQEAVEGYTNLLWTLIMSVIHLLPIPESLISLVIMFLGAGILISCTKVTLKILHEFINTSKSYNLALIFLTATYYPLIFWTLRGMEVGLQTLFILTGVLSTLKLLKNKDLLKNTLLLCLNCFLAVSIRNDSLVSFFIMGLFLSPLVLDSKTRFVPIAFLFTAILTIGSLFGFRHYYYQEFFPNTYYLKVHGVSLLSRVERGIGVLINTGLIHWPLIIFTLILNIKKLIKNKQALLLISIILTQSIYCAYVGGDAWEHYFFANRFLAICFPLIIVLMLYLYKNFESKIKFLPGILTGFTFVFVSILIGLNNTTNLDFILLRFVRYIPLPEAYIWFCFGIVTIFYSFNLNKISTHKRFFIYCSIIFIFTNLRPYGHWLFNNAEDINTDKVMLNTALKIREATSKNAVVAITHAGTSGYFLDRQKIDLLGKSDKFVAKTLPKTKFTPGHNKWEINHSVGKLRPDLVAQMFFKMDLEKWEKTFIEWGYTKTKQGMYILNSSQSVNTNKLEQSL